MRFGLTVHPGFKSPSLRPTCTLSGDSITGEGVRSFGRIPGLIRSPQSAEPMKALASRTWGEATWVYRSVVVTRAWPRISWTTRTWAPCSIDQRRPSASPWRMPRTRATDQRAALRCPLAASRMRRASSHVNGSISCSSATGASMSRAPRCGRPCHVGSHRTPWSGKSRRPLESAIRHAPVGAFVVSRPGDRGGLLPCQHDDTDERLLMASTAAACPTI